MKFCISFVLTVFLLSCGSHERVKISGEPVGPLFINYPADATEEEKADFRKGILYIVDRWEEDFKRPVITVQVDMYQPGVPNPCDGISEFGCYIPTPRLVVIITNKDWLYSIYHELIHATFYHASGGETGPYGSEHKHPDWKKWDLRAGDVARQYQQ